jgi:hypothetical protein
VYLIVSPYILFSSKNDFVFSNNLENTKIKSKITFNKWNENLRGLIMLFRMKTQYNPWFEENIDKLIIGKYKKRWKKKLGMDDDDDDCEYL